MGGEKADKPKRTSYVQDVIDLVLCTGAIYGCYLIYGILQEKIYKEKYGSEGKRFTFSLFLVFFQSIINGLLALAVIVYKKQPENKVPHATYAKVGTSYIGAMWASNYSLHYVSFPTQVLAKSCKVIPVMIMNLIYGHKYSIRDYLSMLSLTFGISIFMLFQEGAKSGGNTSFYGLFLLSLSLAFDAYTSPTQEQAMAIYKPSMDQVMFYLNFYAVILTSFYLIPSGQMYEAVLFLIDSPACLFDVGIYSILSALGQYSILYTLFRFDSLVLAVITTTRKFFSILGSVIIHGHSITSLQWIGVAFVFLGLSVEVYEKYEKKHKKTKHHSSHSASASHTPHSDEGQPSNNGLKNGTKKRSLKAT